MLFKTFTEMECFSSYHFDAEFLQKLPCGLHRCPTEEVEEYLPEMLELVRSAPISNLDEWEVDIKIHMLMDGQYPCLPNFHCDYIGS